MNTSAALKLRFACALLAAGSVLSVAAFAQQPKASIVPDAQVESNVLQALAADPALADQTISTTSVYGTVTLTGAVRDEATRSMAEQVVARTAGVKKVVDELTLGLSSPATASSAPIERGQSGDTSQAQTGDPNAGSNPNLQSDGTIASPDSSQQPGTPSQQQGTQQPYSAAQDPYARGGAGQGQSDAPAGSYGNNDPQAQPQNPQSQPGYPRSQPRTGPYGSPYPQQYPEAQSGNNPPPSSYPSPRPYGAPPYPPQRPYMPPNAGPYDSGTMQAYGRRAEQPGGQPVTVAAGATVQIRTNQGLDSRNTPAGTSFTGVVLNDVIAGGYVAIPRGAQVTGVVSNATSSGVLKGRGELALQLTGVNLAGQSYPLLSDTWSHAGGDKTLRTVDSAVGLGALGAIIGGVAGGGAGAAIGAGVGGAAGIGASAASQGGQVIVPAEAVLTFHLTQPVKLNTVSQAELNRLGAGTPYPGGMRRRYPPPPYAYGPGYYSYPGYYVRRYPYPY